MIEKLQAMVRSNEIVELFSSYEEVLEALEMIQAYDHMMLNLGVIQPDPVKDANLVNETKNVAEKEALEREEELQRRKRNLTINNWRSWCQGLTDLNGLPEIPIDVHNAIVINLFCIDEK